MRQCLIYVLIQILYRLFTGQLHWFICGHTFFPWNSGDLWILDAIARWRLFRLYSTRVSGCTLGVLEMSHRFFIACSLFYWLIYAATLIDPRLWCNNSTHICLINKAMCIILMQDWGVLLPFQKKPERNVHWCMRQKVSKSINLIHHYIV
jgi:hypothetical protein